MIYRVLNVLCLAAGVVFGVVFLDSLKAHAEANATPIVDAGAPSTMTAPVTPPHVDDPTVDAKDFYEDLVAAKKKGWLGLVLVGVYGLTRTIGWFGKRVRWLATLNVGWHAMLIAGVSTVAAAGADALLGGGSLATVLVAMVWAIVGLMSSAKAQQT